DPAADVHERACRLARARATRCILRGGTAGDVPRILAVLPQWRSGLPDLLVRTDGTVGIGRRAEPFCLFVGDGLRALVRNHCDLQRAGAGLLSRDVPIVRVEQAGDTDA